LEAIVRSRPNSRPALERVLRKTAGAYALPLPDKTALLKRYRELVAGKKIPVSPVLEKLLTRRDIRTLSGVAIVTVLTKPFPCPGKCVYCPTEAIMPKSYLSNEPAAMRALLSKFDPFRQVRGRLKALAQNGHATDKIELIIKGGTWSSYQWDYQQWFVKRCYDAFNQSIKSSRSLEESLRRNEKAPNRVIGLTIETRPDWISDKEVVQLRTLGCTRVELGVQSTQDDVLALTKRGHDVAAVRSAGRLLRDAGFKVDYHMMPQLPGSTPERDYQDIKTLFDDPDFRPDMIKIYPTSVVPQAELYEWWKQGRYVPYSDQELFETIIRIKSELIPPYCRISRLIRDIPSTSIAAGNAVTNLREHIQAAMKERGLVCRCLRCREIGRWKEAVGRMPYAVGPKLLDREYEASGGREHFLSFEDAEERAVFAFCRLRLPANHKTAFIRELHTYGHLVEIGGNESGAAQHRGLGKKLMREAERVAKKAGYDAMTVISGVGVREYYRKLGYRLRRTYMVKSL
jgi:elongator complex protein 3